MRVVNVHEYVVYAHISIAWGMHVSSVHFEITKNITNTLIEHWGGGSQTVERMVSPSPVSVSRCLSSLLPSRKEEAHVFFLPQQREKVEFSPSFFRSPIQPFTDFICGEYSGSAPRLIYLCLPFVKRGLPNWRFLLSPPPLPDASLSVDKRSRSRRTRPKAIPSLFCYIWWCNSPSIENVCVGVRVRFCSGALPFFATVSSRANELPNTKIALNSNYRFGLALEQPRPTTDPKN